MIWTDQAIADLTRLQAEGLAYSAIGAELGCSRNAVIGKALRLHLPARGHPTGKRRLPRATPEQTTERKRQVMKLRHRSIELPALDPGAMDLPPDTSPHAVALIDLQDHHCRWPLADGTFCGAMRCDDRKLSERGACAYCSRHAALAYQPRRAAA